MKKFIFEMESVLELRKFQQQEAEAELGKANAVVAEIQRKLDDIAVKHISTINNFNDNTDLETKYQIQNYLNLLNYKKESLLKEKVEAEMIADQKREVVRQCMQKTEVLENLKTDELKQWKKEQQKKEENEMDDVVSSTFTAKKNTAHS